MKPLISICIPTYNGQAVLAQTLDSIVAQYRDGLEVVICDDGSSDRTVEIAMAYADRHPSIIVFRNPQNLGMDSNFTQSVRHACGTYVWLSGQDDIFEPGAVEKVFDLLQFRPDLDLVYLNYRFMSGDLSREVSPPLLAFRDDRFYEGAAAYFRDLDSAPSFLPATLMRREFWDKTPVDAYFGTHYVQVAVWLLNGADAKIAVVGDPKFITCRMPEESWKYTGGKMLFEIFTGKFFVYKTVRDAQPDCVPHAIVHSFDQDYFENFARKVIVLKSMGLVVTPEHVARVRALAHSKAHFYLLLRPALLVPVWLARVTMALYRLLLKQRPNIKGR